MLHFEIPIKEYCSNKIIEMTNTCLQKICIQLGDILEPISPLCRTKDPKAWNDMIKMHFKDPATNGNMLLAGIRIFILTLDGKQRAAKVCKSYANMAYNEQTIITIMGETLKDLSVHEIHVELIKTSLRKGQDFEITQVCKTIKDKIVYIIAASSEQKTKAFATPSCSALGTVYTKPNFAASLDQEGNWEKKLPHSHHQECQHCVFSK